MRCNSRPVLPARLSFSFWRRPRQSNSPSWPRSAPPRLEQLEDRLTPSAPGINTLALLDGTNGIQTLGGLVMDNGGLLYGASLGLKTYLFQVAPQLGGIGTVASLPGSAGSPIGSLAVDSSGNIYGATAQLGGLSGGIIYELPKGGSTVTTLATFTDTNGKNPSGGVVVDGRGNLFGLTGSTIFEVAKGSKTITTLATIPPVAAGDLTMDASGNLFGTTNSTIFELAKGSSTITTLASGLFGITNEGVILDSSGNLYGTGVNTVFELPKGSSKVTTLATTDGTNIVFTTSRLVMDKSGNLFGTSPFGAFNSGAVYEVAKGSGKITTIASFNGKTDGSHPDSLPIMDSAGTLYGTTAFGGAHGFGTIFSLKTETPKPTQLEFARQPTGGAPGATMNPVIVAIEDQFGNIETDDNSDTITLALGANLHGGTLHGTTTLTVRAGVATFSDLSIDQLGNGYTLTASTSASGVAPITSVTFNITPGGGGGAGGGGGSGGSQGGGSTVTVSGSVGGFSFPIALPAPGQSAGVFGMALEEIDLVFFEDVAFFFAAIGQPNPQYEELVSVLLNAINNDPIPAPLGWLACAFGFEEAQNILL